MKFSSIAILNLLSILKLIIASRLKNTSLPFNLLPITNDMLGSTPYQAENDLLTLNFEENNEKNQQTFSSTPKEKSIES